MRRSVFVLSFLGAALWGSLAFATCPTGGAIEAAIYGCPLTGPPYASSLRIPVAPSATPGALEYFTADTLVDTSTAQTIGGPKTLTNPTINGSTQTGTIAGSPSYSGNPLYTGIISGTVVAGGFLGLDSGNHLVKAAPAGTGNVTGPGSSVNTNFACWNGTGGTLLSDCGYNTSHFLVTTSNLTDLSNVATGRNNLLAATSGGTPTRYLGLDSGNNVVTGTPSGGSVSITALDASIVVNPSPLTGTGTIAVGGPSHLTTFTAGTVPMGAGASPLVASEITDVASGGVTVGSPTGGQKGAGTINMTGCFINNVPCAAGSSVAWSTITGGTNTAAAMVVGTGASIAPTGSGAITATIAPVSGLTGAGTGVLTFLATPSSANLASALTDETGSGAAVFGTSPTITGSPIFNLGSDATGDIYYRAPSTGALTRLGIGSTGNVLTVAAGLPSWAAPAAGTAANPTATISTSIQNGSASTYMRSDAAPAAAVGTNSTKGYVQGDGLTIDCTTVAGTCASAAGVTNATTSTSGTGASPTVAQFGAGWLKNLNAASLTATIPASSGLSNAGGLFVAGINAGTIAATSPDTITSAAGTTGAGGNVAVNAGCNATVTTDGAGHIYVSGNLCSASGGNTTSTSLTTNALPKANGANSIIDSSISDSGSAVSVTGRSFGLTGNLSAAAWTTNGIRYQNAPATLTDTTSSGPVAAAYTNSFGANTIAASSATTFTNYYNSYFKDPIAGTNVTLTNKWALGADSAQIANLTVTGTCTGCTGSTAAFGSLSSGTNTTAAMVVGTGASMSFAGTSLPTPGAGVLGIAGEATKPTLAANGEGDVWLDSTTGGLGLIGKGSGSDISMYNSAGTLGCAMATGTTTLACIGLQGGTLTATGVTTVATVDGAERTVTAGSTDTLLSTDCGKTVLYNNAAYTVTIPAAIVPAAGTSCQIDIVTDTANKVTVTGTAVSAATLVSADSYTGTRNLAGSGISLKLINDGATKAYLFGFGS